ncbi:hypothetical protein D3C81_1153170 [compost metagenome]
MGDVVGRDRKGEHPALGIAGLHHFDVGAVEQVHFGLQLTIGEGHFFTANHRDLLAQIFRADPVEGQVGKGCLGAPARRHVEVVDELLDGLADLFVGQPVLAHIGRQVGVEGTEGLGPGPLVLQRAKEIDHLPQGAAQVSGRPGLDPSGYAIEAFVQQGAQRPAGTVAGEHIQVMHVQVGFAMGTANGFAVDLIEPVVGGDFAGDIEHQPAQRVTLVGVGLNPPVFTVEVLVHRGRHFDQGLAVATQAPVLFAVDDIGA